MCLLGKLRIIEKKWNQNYFYGKSAYRGNLESVEKKWHQNYFHGKCAYWGNLESLKRNCTRTISTVNVPAGET
jgi:hypothetical protein